MPGFRRTHQHQLARRADRRRPRGSGTPEATPRRDRHQVLPPAPRGPAPRRAPRRRSGRGRRHPPPAMRRRPPASPDEVEGGIEGLAVLPREVLLDRPVEVLEIRRAGAPLEVVAQLVGQRLPGLVLPVESRRHRAPAPRTSRGRARSGSGCLGPAARRRPGSGMHSPSVKMPGRSGMRQRPGRHDDLGDAVEKLAGHLAGQPDRPWLRSRRGA